MTDLQPLRDQQLEADADRFAREQGLPEIPVKVAEVKEFTTAPNAEAAGLGPSRRVILWDTLLERPFDDDEIRVVLAHELGHHSRDHIWKGFGWYALFALPIAFVIALATRRRGGMYDPRAVPLALLSRSCSRSRSPRPRTWSPALRGGGGLGRAPDHARPGRGARGLRRPGRDEPGRPASRRPGPTCWARPIPRSCSGSRWPTPGARRNGRSGRGSR